MAKAKSKIVVRKVQRNLMGKTDWFNEPCNNQNTQAFLLKPEKQDSISTSQPIEIIKEKSLKIPPESDSSEDSQGEVDDMLEEEEPAMENRRRYPNISKNLLKFLTDTVLTRRWQKNKLLIEKMNRSNPDPKKFAQDYKEYLMKVEQTHNKKFNKTDMVELLTHTYYGRTTRILFDRLRRKDYDSRMFYSKIQNFRQHLLFNITLKKILKDPERFLRIRLLDPMILAFLTPPIFEMFLATGKSAFKQYLIRFKQYKNWQDLSQQDFLKILLQKIKFIFFNKQAIYQKYKPNFKLPFYQNLFKSKNHIRIAQTNRISEQHKKIQHWLNQSNQCQNSSRSRREIQLATKPVFRLELKRLTTNRKIQFLLQSRCTTRLEVGQTLSSADKNKGKK